MVPRWPDAAQRLRLAPIAGALIAGAAGGLGRTREEVEATWEAEAPGVKDRIVAAGLKKLVDD